MRLEYCIRGGSTETLARRENALRFAKPQTVPRHCSTLAKTPAHLREELAKDYRRMMHGETREADLLTPPDL
jgi:hypothetical protein